MPFVAPYVGAWIETLHNYRNTQRGRVAPYVGAWIETYLISTAASTILSHPTWVRGLKLFV